MSDILLIILGATFMLSGFALCIRPIIPGVLISYIGMFMLHYVTAIPSTSLTFWGIATLLILGIDFLSPKTKNGFEIGAVYLGIGTLAGMLIGLAIDSTLTVAGAFVGAVIGELAFARTPHGKHLLFHSSTIIHYFCARGLRIIVTVSMIGVVINEFLKI